MSKLKKETLGDKKAEIVEKNFLKEQPDYEDLPPPAECTDKIIVPEKEIPPPRRVVFVNMRDPGSPLEFCYHSKTMPMKRWTMIPGEAYLLPQEIIDHVESLSIPIYGKNPMAKDTKHCSQIVGHDYSFRFISPEAAERQKSFASRPVF